MRFIEKVVGIIIILLLLGLHFPEISFSWQRAVYAKADTSKTITKHAPEFLAPPEIEIPLAMKQPAKQLGKKKINKWVWVGLGVLAAGVLAGAGGGGGEGDGDNGDDTGTIVINGPAP
jgi:hypothetical protein